jgi:toxin YoeB
MYEIKFDPKVTKVIAKWKKSNPVLFKKLRNVLEDIMEHPRTGIGHPEPLVGGGDITYSRHISAHDRIIYRIHDEEVFVLVVEVEGHYNDK